MINSLIDMVYRPGEKLSNLYDIYGLEYKRKLLSTILRIREIYDYSFPDDCIKELSNIDAIKQKVSNVSDEEIKGMLNSCVPGILKDLNENPRSFKKGDITKLLCKKIFGIGC